MNRLPTRFGGACLVVLLAGCEGPGTVPSAPEAEGADAAAVDTGHAELGEGHGGEGDEHDPAAATRDWAELRPPGDLSLLELPAAVHTGAESLTHVDMAFSGIVERVEVVVGDRVELGDPLLLVRSPGLAQAAATVSTASSRIDAHKLRRDHLDALRAEGIVGANAVFEIDTQLGSLDAQRRQALALLESLGLDQADRRSLRKDGRVMLRARARGIITEVDAHNGEAVSVGQALATIRGAGSPRIEVAYFDQLPESVKLEFVSLSGEVTALSSTPVAASIEPGLGRTLAWFTPSEAAQMADGVVGKVRIVGLEANVFELPRRALRMHEGAPHVLRRGEGGELEAVAVEVLRSGGASAIVRSDVLAVGEFVAADAAAVLDFGRDPNSGGHQH